MGPRPQTRRVPRSAATWRKKAGCVAAQGEVDGLAVALFQALAPAVVEGSGVPEAGAHVGQIGARDDQHAPGARGHQGGERRHERLRLGVAGRIPGRRLGGAEAAEDGHDARRRRPRPERVAEEDGLELQRVLGLVEVLVLAQVEAARGLELADGLEIGLERAQRGVEGLGADGEGPAHRRVRGAEEDEGVDALVEPVAEGAVGVP